VAQPELHAKLQLGLLVVIMLQLPILGAPNLDFAIHSKVLIHYNADAFNAELTQHGLSSSYPFLSHFLHSDFPLGSFELLTKIIILPKGKVCKDFPNLIWTYI
jgi:hypothetical protein